jgi:hypothetical protein
MYSTLYIIRRICWKVTKDFVSGALFVFDKLKKYLYRPGQTLELSER